MIGVAVSKGLLDIDRPVHEYGVSPLLADWNETGVDYFKQLTTRHIITQATGYGRVPPGSFFTYNSDTFVCVGGLLPLALPPARAPMTKRKR